MGSGLSPSEFEQAAALQPSSRSSLPVCRRRLHLHLEAALAALRPEAVQILVLRYTHNWSDKQIAALLGVSRVTIAVRLLRARARLRTLMRISIGEEQ
jgi:RNA polymerase sigma factor (sigma-70 family)